MTNCASSSSNAPAGEAKRQKLGLSQSWYNPEPPSDRLTQNESSAFETYDDDTVQMPKFVVTSAASGVFTETQEGAQHDARQLVTIDPPGTDDNDKLSAVLEAASLNQWSVYWGADAESAEAVAYLLPTQWQPGESQEPLTLELTNCESLGAGSYGYAVACSVANKRYTLKAVNLLKLPGDTALTDILQRETGANFYESRQASRTYLVDKLCDAVAKEPNVANAFVTSYHLCRGVEEIEEIEDVVDVLRAHCEDDANSTHLGATAQMLVALYEAIDFTLESSLLVSDEDAVSVLLEKCDLILRSCKCRDVALNISTKYLTANEYDLEKFRTQAKIEGTAGGYVMPNTLMNLPLTTWIELRPTKRTAFLFILSEFHPCTLSDYLSRLPTVPFRDSFERYVFTDIISDLQQALQDLCEHGCVHRDVKPSNVVGQFMAHTFVRFANCTALSGRIRKLYVRKTGFDARLSDFSLMRKLRDNRNPLRRDTTTQLTQAVGGGSYIAPEVMNGGNYDSKVDIFSLGMLYYHILVVNTTLRVPSIGLLRSYYVRENEIIQLPELFAATYPEESRVIEKMLAYAADERIDMLLLNDAILNLQKDIANSMAIATEDDMWLVPSCQARLEKHLRMWKPKPRSTTESRSRNLRGDIVDAICTMHCVDDDVDYVRAAFKVDACPEDMAAGRHDRYCNFLGTDTCFQSSALNILSYI